ncbi:sensor histidine kinase [Leucobacter sp. CSA1]|uniref:histidine kinase n=1 Tax=Leucobacter chromiisoli TaxID=2796471 RepID=A0A934UTV2_9MICO|nr:sensor histidine kinase [Leucobacter chromiisoli]MBK0417543.1 sensor histidine kinase [Leucobacter chromiisoli]
MSETGTAGTAATADTAAGAATSDTAGIASAVGVSGSAEWRRPKPGAAGLRSDVGIAILLAIASPVTALLYHRTGLYEEVAPPWVWVLGLGLGTLPLALRRRFPVPAAILVSIGFFICNQFGVPDLLVVQICLFTALYTIGAWEQNRRLAFWSRFGITAAMLIWVVLNLIVSSSDETLFPGLPRTGIFSAFATFAAIQIITNLVYFGGAFLFGERAWRTARLMARLEAQGHELELERQTSADQAVALDRIAIARELHDVVAHHVSVMGIQAAAARRSLERSPGRAAEALEIVEESAHSAVTELRRLVHTLREPASDDPSSTIGVAQLSALIADSQRAGTPTTLIVVGEQRPLPLLVDVALYRVVQEALTNVRKHAGRGAEATVRLRFRDAEVEVEVADTGTRQTLSPRGAGSGGHGLRGMRERLGTVGGSLRAERRERGGFLVVARVPLAPARHGGSAGGPDDGGSAVGSDDGGGPGTSPTGTGARATPPGGGPLPAPSSEVPA